MSSFNPTPTEEAMEGQAGARRVLIVTAVDAERDAVLRGLQGSDRFHVIAAGAGRQRRRRDPPRHSQPVLTAAY